MAIHYIMINYRILVSIIFLLVSCRNKQPKKETLKTINVPLYSRVDSSPFPMWVNSMYYMDDLQEQFSIPIEGDSVVMYYDAVDPRGFKKVLEKREKLGDTAVYDKQKSSIHVLTGLDGENQFYIIDQKLKRLTLTSPLCLYMSYRRTLRTHMNE